MTPTLPFLRERFAHFNRLIFAGRLPELPIALCEVTSFVGQYKSKVRVAPDGVREHYDHLLRFSTAFSLTEREIEDTLIHEMIHYFIALNGLQDRSAHGLLFRAMMQAINEAHGRNIGISHRTTRQELDSARAVAKKWHVIAVLRFTSGELGVKVLPRVIPKVIDYYRQISAAPNIKAVDLYLHNDGFFNRFPTSVGRRCHAITEAELTAHLHGAHTLKVKGDKLIQS